MSVTGLCYTTKGAKNITSVAHPRIFRAVAWKVKPVRGNPITLLIIRKNSQGTRREFASSANPARPTFDLNESTDIVFPAVCNKLQKWRDNWRKDGLIASSFNARRLDGLPGSHSSIVSPVSSARRRKLLSAGRISAALIKFANATWNVPTIAATLRYVKRSGWNHLRSTTGELHRLLLPLKNTTKPLRILGSTGNTKRD